MNALNSEQGIKVGEDYYFWHLRLARGQRNYAENEWLRPAARAEHLRSAQRHDRLADTWYTQKSLPSFYGNQRG